MGIILRVMWFLVMWDYTVIVDKLAKQAMKHMNNEVQIPLSKAEIKVIIKEHINEMWDRGVKAPIQHSKTSW